mgnify:CR=1 FL=1
MDCSTHSSLLCHWALVPTKRPDASCRGGLNGRPCAPPRRMHPVGADAHIGPLGIDIKSTIAERAYHSVRNRVRYTQSRWSMHPVPGGYIIRPYGVDGGACGSADCPVPGDWRADVGIGPLGIDLKSTTVERTYRRGAHGASGAGCDIRKAGGRCTRFRADI